MSRHERDPYRDLGRRTFLFAGATGIGLLPRREQEKEDEDDVSPPEDLMREHGILKRVLLVYDEAIRRIDTKQELSPDAVRDAATIIRTFIEDYHEKLEEDYLFPRFEKAGRLTDLTKVLRAQHQAGRRLTEQITRSATLQELKNPQSAAALKDAMQQFVRMYAPHEAREDTVLFPALRTVVSKTRVRRARRGLREEGTSAVRRGGVREDGGPGRGDRESARHLRPRAIHAKVGYSTAAPVSVPDRRAVSA